MALKQANGFSLVELIAVLVILGVLASTATSILLPSRTLQLQAARDQVIAALFAAQQLAMTQSGGVRASVGAGQIDIREDLNSNGDFSDDVSQRVGGVQYPISLLKSQSISSLHFDYNRLGQTSGGLITLSQDSSAVVITVTDSGYAY